MKNVSFIIRGFNGGGIESSTLNLIKMLSKNTNVNLIVLSGKVDLDSLNERINVKLDDSKIVDSFLGKLLRVVNMFIPFLGTYLFSERLYSCLLFKYQSLLGSGDVYLCGMNCYNLFARSGSDNVIIQCHSTNSFVLKERSKIFYLFSKILFSLSLKDKKIFAVSKGVADDLINNLGLSSSSIVVVNNVINLRTLIPYQEEIVKGNTIIHVGNFSDNKNQELLIKSFLSSDSCHDYQLVFLGKGKQLEFCKEIAKGRKNILFLGHVENPLDYIRKAKLIILCSNYEGYPMVLLEAAAVGTNFLAYKKLSGINDILEHGFIGYTYKENNVNTLSKAIDNSLIINDSSLTYTERLKLVEKVNLTSIENYL